jgi:hypothetical protein
VRGNEEADRLIGFPPVKRKLQYDQKNDVIRFGVIKKKWKMYM